MDPPAIITNTTLQRHATGEPDFAALQLPEIVTEIGFYLTHSSVAELPEIRELVLIKNKMTPLEELGFAARCHALQVLQWQTMSSLSEDGEMILVQDVVHARFLFLRALNISHSALKDVDIAAIIDALPALVNLDANVGYFGQESTRAVVGMKSRIQELDIRGCTNVHSSMIQYILASSSGLETFRGDIFNMGNLVRGQPWTCLRLKTLQLSISISIKESLDDEARLHYCERICSQLAELTELTELDLRDEYNITGISSEWIELTLSHGLGRLGSLHKLKQFRSRGLGEAERAWAQKHWPQVSL
ncbi:hypothetical protein EDD11_002747 [Mortierella claussenii]|nr:hypothetical protein EDD11_002747 [Mortierella claussenii]